LVVPTGGKMTFTLRDSYAQQVDAGVSRFQFANDVKFTNFILGANVVWNTSGNVLTGCGFIVSEDTENNHYVLAYIDSAGGYGLAVREDDEFTDNLFADTLNIGRPPYQVVLVVVDDAIHYYLNGVLVGSLDYATIAGGVGEAVVNFERNNTQCRYNSLWIWSWD
jgi:hypothetical protein